jgi:hypothetical protein
MEQFDNLLTLLIYTRNSIVQEIGFSVSLPCARNYKSPQILQSPT